MWVFTTEVAIGRRLKAEKDLDTGREQHRGTKGTEREGRKGGDSRKAATSETWQASPPTFWPGTGCGTRCEAVSKNRGCAAMGPVPNSVLVIVPEGDSPIFVASCHKNRDSPPRIEGGRHRGEISRVPAALASSPSRHPQRSAWRSEPPRGLPVEYAGARGRLERLVSSSKYRSSPGRV